MKTISQHLHSPKRQGWRTAYLYQTIHTEIQKFLASELDQSMLSAEYFDFITSLKEEDKKLTITLQIKNTNFLTWLKINEGNLKDYIKKVLLKQDILTKKQDLDFIFKTK